MFAATDIAIVVLSVINMLMPVALIFGVIKVLKHPDADQYIPRGDSYALPPDGISEQTGAHALLPEPMRSPKRLIK